MPKRASSTATQQQSYSNATADADADLSALLFGAPSANASNLDLDLSPPKPAWADDDDDDDDDDDEGSDDDNSSVLPSSSAPAHAPAWEDTTDPSLSVSLASSSRAKKLRVSESEDGVSLSDYESRLRARHAKVVAGVAGADFTSWAAPGAAAGLPSSSGYDSEASAESSSSLSRVLASSAPLLSSPSLLPPTTLAAHRLPDVNLSSPSKSTVCASRFHPHAPVAFTAGYDKTLRFFTIAPPDHKGNVTTEKIHGVHFPDLPVMRAEFMKGGDRVILAGRRPFLYLYDVTSGTVSKVPNPPGRSEKGWEVVAARGEELALGGKGGEVILVDGRCMSSEPRVMKMNGTCRSVCFRGEAGLVASGGDGVVHEWDLRMGRGELSKFGNDDGTPVQSVSAGGGRLAVGCESGVVNVYGGRRGERRLEKSVMNLTTSADCIKFNHNGEILALTSRRSRDALRLLHVGSGTVFKNWPTSKTPLGYVWDVDFSPGGGYLAVGNDKGKCLLYRLYHYAEGW